MNEQLKYIMSLIIKTGISVFKLFPIKNNRIIFNSYNGNQYSCNPKSISDYLNTYEKDKYEIIWAFNNPNNFLELTQSGIKILKYRSIKYYYFSMTSKVTVCNCSGGGEIPARKDHFEIQTWHGGGGGYKKSATDDKTINSYSNRRFINDSKRYSLICISSKTSLNNTARGGLHHKGLVLGGTPRNDILINHNCEDLFNKVHDYFKISREKKILLYAPTWRKGNISGNCTLDFNLLCKKLASKFGGEWVVVVRLHYLAKQSMNINEKVVYDGCDYQDMQELLYVADCLITDYSSSIWDYSFTYKPCFLYCKDLKDFIEERDFYKPIHSWGFPIAESDEDLYRKVMEFNQKKFIYNMHKHHKENNSFEEGHATKDVVRIIEAVCFGNGEMPNDIKFV